MSETTTTDAQEAAQPDAEQQTFTADYVAKLRAENANYRTKAKENAKAADELAALRDANKSEAEKLAESLAKAQQEAQDWHQTVESALEEQVMLPERLHEAASRVYLWERPSANKLPV